MNLLDSYGVTKDRYLELINEFPLRPIRTNSELNAAIQLLFGLRDQPRRDEAEEDYAAVLGDLIDRHQQAVRTRPAIRRSDILRFLIESRDITVPMLSIDVGIAESTFSDVLAGNRQFTKDEIERVAAYFQLLPTVLAVDE